MQTTATRANHVEFLDRYYGSQRHVYDLTRRFFLFGRDRLLRRLDPQPGECVLELGCGTARNLVHMARHQPAAEYVGVDASQAMLDTARRNLGNLPVRLEARCAESLTGPGLLGKPGGFDVVFLSYSLSMMPDWAGALAAARACLAPRGRLGLVDFWDFGGWPRWLARRLQARLAAHHVRFDPAMLRWLKDAAGSNGTLELTPLAGRWAFLALLRPDRGQSA